MEYVVVHFAEPRQVLVDDVPLGSTEDTLEVDEGHHSFSLEGTPDFTPTSIETAVTDTSVLDRKDARHGEAQHRGADRSVLRTETACW